MFPLLELTEDIHPQIEEISGVWGHTKINPDSAVLANLSSKKHKQCDEALTRKEGLLWPRNIQGNLGVLEVCRLSRILRGKDDGEAGGEI